MPDYSQVSQEGYLIALTGFDKKAERVSHKKPNHQPSF